jgi:hypothetical protein
MVTQLGWEPLQVRRVKIRLLLLFKIQHNLVAINLIYTVRNWEGGKLPSVSLNSSTELAVVAADGRLFHSRMDLGEKEFR